METEQAQDGDPVRELGAVWVAVAVWVGEGWAEATALAQDQVDSASAQTVDTG